MSRKSIASRLIGHCMCTGQVCLCVTYTTWCRCCSWCCCIITTFRDCCETSRNEISVRLRRALNAISHYGHNLQCVCYFMTRNCMQHVSLMWTTHTCTCVCAIVLLCMYGVEFAHTSRTHLDIKTTCHGKDFHCRILFGRVAIKLTLALIPFHRI